MPRPMPARKANLEDFLLLKTVGKGSFGKVVMVRLHRFCDNERFTSFSTWRCCLCYDVADGLAVAAPSIFHC